MLGTRSFIVTLPNGRDFVCEGVSESYLLLHSLKDRKQLYRYDVHTGSLLIDYDERRVRMDAVSQSKLPSESELLVMGFLTKVASGKVSAEKLEKGLRVVTKAKVVVWHHFIGGYEFYLDGEYATSEQISRFLIQL